MFVNAVPSFDFNSLKLGADVKHMFLNACTLEVRYSHGAAHVSLLTKVDVFGCVTSHSLHAQAMPCYFLGLP